jgi:hypothetical protein
MSRPEFTKRDTCDHGWVYPSTTGYRAECGGPRHCKACRSDLVTLYESGDFAEQRLKHQYTDPHSVLAHMLEAMKGQMLIVLVNRLGGQVEIPVAEVDGTGAFMMNFGLTAARDAFVFQVTKKQ